jgi:hypothetical protein
VLDEIECLTAEDLELIVGGVVTGEGEPIVICKLPADPRGHNLRHQRPRPPRPRALVTAAIMTNHYAKSQQEHRSPPQR